MISELDFFVLEQPSFRFFKMRSSMKVSFHGNSNWSAASISLDKLSNLTVIEVDNP